MVVVPVEPSVAWVHPHFRSVSVLPYPPCFSSPRFPPENPDFRRSVSCWSDVIPESKHSASISKNSRRILFRDIPKRCTVADRLGNVGEVRSMTLASGEYSKLFMVAFFFAIVACLLRSSASWFQMRPFRDDRRNNPEAFAFLEGNEALDVRCTLFTSFSSEDEVSQIGFSFVPQAPEICDISINVVVNRKAPMFSLPRWHMIPM